jgi:hypothetical protein
MVALLAATSASGMTAPEESRTVPVIEPASCACAANGMNNITINVHRRTRAIPVLPIELDTEFVFGFIGSRSERILKLGKKWNVKAPRKTFPVIPAPSVRGWSRIGHTPPPLDDPPPGTKSAIKTN